MADLSKDEYLEKSDTTKKDKAYLRGQVKVYEEIVGIVNFMKSFKTPQEIQNRR